MLRYLGPGEDFMATQGQDYVDYAKFAAGKRLSVETHVGGPIDNILSGMEQANAVYPIGKLKWKIAHPNNERADRRAARPGEGARHRLVADVLERPDRRRRAAVQVGDEQQRAHVPGDRRDERRGVGAVPDDLDGHHGQDAAAGPADTGVPADQRLTRTEALRHYTTECAWFMDQEGRLGSLEPGYHGDLIVLSDDYFNVSDDMVKDLKSVLTVVDGQIVYSDGTLVSATK